MSFNRPRITLKYQSIFFILFIFFSCGEDCVRPDDKTFIAPGTESLMIEFRSAVDNQVIPVYIAFPSAPKHPMKAIVILHGSGGAWDDDDTDGDGIGDDCNVGSLSKQNKEWGALLLSNGYAVAFPDSYTTRNTCENEGDYKVPPLKFKISATFVRNLDAQGVLGLLSQLTWEDSDQPIIDVNGIALIGFSDGGSAGLSTVFDERSTQSNWLWKQTFDGVTYSREIRPPAKRGELDFKAAVLYYPGSYHNGYYGELCNGTGIYKSYCDIMFHLAGDDPLTENSECLISTMKNLGGGNPIVFRYEGAHHGFDSNDEPETATARARTLVYLNDLLGQ